MRIRRRPPAPALVLSSPPPICIPDLSSEREEELEYKHPRSPTEGAAPALEMQDAGKSAEHQHRIEDLRNPQVLNRQLKESHYSHHPSVNGSNSSGAPPWPANNEANGCNEEGRKRRRGNGAVLMEGSRCSRVNGRGWRCSQATLVGYSLCEHHLGKGRLRSMTAVKKPEKKKMTKKTNVGVVKARSITSLLVDDGFSGDTRAHAALARW